MRLLRNLLANWRARRLLTPQERRIARVFGVPYRMCASGSTYANAEEHRTVMIAMLGLDEEES